MIARVAEQCFWMARYLERVENTARQIQVNVSFLLDADLPELTHWRPMLLVAGELDHFVARFGEPAADRGDRVQDYMVWDDQNPVSLQTSLRSARDNARTIRETISLEMWVGLNSFWLWFHDREAQQIFRRDPHAFYEEIRETCGHLAGTTQDTMLHDEAFDFMRLGTLLERAGQVCRMLDIKYHALGPTSQLPESPAEAAQWLAILRSCSASEAFFKRMSVSPRGPVVAGFLLFEPDFPRSVMHCLTRAWHFMRRIRPSDSLIGQRSTTLMQNLLRTLRATSIERMLERGLHLELDRIVSRVAEISEAIALDYFSPETPIRSESA
ncbi:MAG: alpha-E domain-containing protein [Gemmatimonadota bacterium]|nr:alpha-E domain-containing protein [Gemmatimonadota bacterium]MDH5197651.1 alpha-E domain-containing protein [Gemmatimonadota bacterium]